MKRALVITLSLVLKSKAHQDKEAVHNNENNDKTGLDVEIHPLLKI